MLGCGFTQHRFSGYSFANCFFSFVRSIGDLIRVEFADIRPEGTQTGPGCCSLTKEVLIVIIDWLPAKVAHGLPTCACHLVAPLLLKVFLLALDIGTLPEHGFSHGVLHLGPGLHLCVFLHLVTGEGDVALLSALPTRLPPALGIAAGYDLVLAVGRDNDCIVTAGALN